MRIPICHHYWKDGQDAFWHPAAFPVPQLETAIKSDYLALQCERPKWRKYGSFWVVFDYRPATDVFGRQIVPISFAFLPEAPDAEMLLPKIHTQLCKAANDQITIDLPESTPSPKLVKKRRITGRILRTLALCAILALIAISSIIGVKENRAPVTGQRSIRKPTPSALVCENAHYLLTCPRLYALRRCQKRTNLTYREFRESQAVCHPLYGTPEPWSSGIRIFRVKPSAEIAEAIEKFIFNE